MLLFFLVLPLFVRYQILLQKIKRQTQNSNVIDLAQSDNIIGYDVNRTDYISQPHQKDDNRPDGYIPVVAFPVIPDKG